MLSHISVSILSLTFQTCWVCLSPSCYPNSLHQVEILLVLPNILKTSFAMRVTIPTYGLSKILQVSCHVAGNKKCSLNMYDLLAQMHVRCNGREKYCTSLTQWLKTLLLLPWPTARYYDINKFFVVLHTAIKLYVAQKHKHESIL